MKNFYKKYSAWLKKGDDDIENESDDESSDD
jgi:hypothetical protein